MADAAHHEPSAIHHVLDQKEHWELFDRLFGEPVGLPLLHFNLFGHDFHLTKFMILEVIAAVLVAWMATWIARRIQTGEPPKGKRWNLFESFLTFIRDEIARPNMGDKEAERFLPFLWTLFFFILFCNLLGMLPWLGSPTANISVTGALAFVTFLLLHLAPIVRHGVWKYMKSFWVDIGLPWYGFPLQLIIGVLIAGIELMGTVIKSFVLSVRLFANMLAGHMVLATILLFIVTTGKAGFSGKWVGVTAASVIGVFLLSLLELFVAFLQAYIFTFLTSLFVGMAVEHAAGHHDDHGHEEGHGHGHDHGHGHGTGEAHGHGHAPAH